MPRSWDGKHGAAIPNYYRKEWVGGRCFSIYCGRGELATLLAELDQFDRQRRQQERAINQVARAEFAELAATSVEITLLLAEARTAVAEALTAAGYHQHKRGNGGDDVPKKKKAETEPAPLIGPQTREQWARTTLKAMHAKDVTPAAREEYR
jgi:hypothetical protein